MPTGTVKMFNATKGYGYIAADDGGEDIFFQVIALENAETHDRKVGQRVIFDLVPDRRKGKFAASNLKIAQ